jgi:hypothetical protein
MRLVVVVLVSIAAFVASPGAWAQTVSLSPDGRYLWLQLPVGDNSRTGGALLVSSVECLLKGNNPSACVRFQGPLSRGSVIRWAGPRFVIESGNEAAIRNAESPGEAVVTSTIPQTRPFGVSTLVSPESYGRRMERSSTDIGRRR